MEQAARHPTDDEREAAVRPALAALLRALETLDGPAFAELLRDDAAWLAGDGRADGADAALRAREFLAADAGRRWADPQQRGAHAVLRWGARDGCPWGLGGRDPGGADRDGLRGPVTDPATDDRLAALRAAAEHGLVGLLGIDVLSDADQTVVADMRIHEGLMAPNGFLHGGSIVALADTACGFGCWLRLPDKAPGFTTVEITTNFVGAARVGILRCTARCVHEGRTTQVWDAVVTRDDGRQVALFRCTQLILDAVPSVISLTVG